MPRWCPELWPQIEPRLPTCARHGRAVVNQDVRAGSHRRRPARFDHWLASYYPVRLNDEVIGIGVVVVDITDREQAEDFRAVVMQNMAEGLIRHSTARDD